MDISKKLFTFLSYLIVLIPLTLITGPFLPDLIVILLGLYYLLFCYKNNKFYEFNNLFFKFFIIFCLYSTLVSLSSLNVFSLKSSFFYIRFGVFSLAVSFFLLKKPKIINYIFYLFVTIFIVLFFDSIYQYFFSKNIIGFEYINKTNFRVTSFFGKDEVLGSYIARFFPFLLFLILVNYDSNFSKKVNFFITTLTIISFSIVLISGERTAIGLFILSFVFIYFSSQKFRKIFMVPLIGIIIVFIFAVSMSEKIKHRIVTTTLNQMGLNAGSERIVLFSKTYEGHYKIAANMFEEKPLIGHGAKMFRFYCSKDENYVAPNACTTHPHNFYAQMLAELGIIGFLTLLVLFFYITYFFLKNLYFQIFKDRQFISNESICLLGFYFMTLFPFLPSGNFFNNWLSIIIYYPLGFLIYIIKRGKFYA